MTKLDFCVLEDTYAIPGGAIYERWFITRSNSKNPVRRELYKTNTSGYVIAFADSGIGVDKSLYMEQTYFDMFRGESEFDGILKDQGILDPDLVKTYRME